jgi:hypothetical protein
MNNNKALDIYYSLKSPKTVSKPTDKTAIPGSNIGYVGKYYKEQSKDILNSIDDQSFKDAVEKFQLILDDTRTLVNNINI